MRNQRGSLWIILVVSVMAGLGVLLAACGGGRSGPTTDIDEQPWEVRLESPLDTVTVTQGEDLEDKDVLDPPEGPVVSQPVVKETTPPSSTAPSPPAKTFTPGWRVQVFASPSMSAAETEAEVARQKFAEPVYLEYEPPYYKVRVGDFLTKDSARSLSNRAKSQGYEGAWVVETMVVRPQG